MTKKTREDSLFLTVAWLAMGLASIFVPTIWASNDESGPAAEAFESFKNLAGEWQGTDARGDDVRLVYEVTADGSAVLERFSNQQGMEMLTIYHLDGDRLLLTHYCVAGNQPRMHAKSISKDEVRFELLDATGLRRPDEGHMNSAVFRFGQSGTLSSAWTWREKGKDSYTEAIELRRISDAASK